MTGLELPAAIGLFLAALGAGFVDSIAGGGGLIAFPALLAAGLPPHIAAGTNKFQSTFGTALAAWRYHRAGWMASVPLTTGIVVTFLAAVAGAYAATRISPAPYRKILPCLLLIPLIYIVLHPWLKPGQHGSPDRLQRFLPVLGLALGAYDGFFGPGTGSFWMLGLLALGNFEIPQATAMTKILNLASNLAALLWFATRGQVEYGVGIIMIAGQLIGSTLGSAWAIRHGAKGIRPVFIVVALAMIVYLFRS